MTDFLSFSYFSLFLNVGVDILTPPLCGSAHELARVHIHMRRIRGYNVDPVHTIHFRTRDSQVGVRATSPLTENIMFFHAFLLDR